MKRTKTSAIVSLVAILLVACTPGSPSPGPSQPTRQTSAPTPLPEPSGENVALNKPVIASNATVDSPVEIAVDGNPDTAWIAGDYPPQYIEIDLQGTYNLTAIRLLAAQDPPGPTTHRVWARGEDGEYRMLYEIRGNTQDNQFLDYAPPEGWQGIRYIRVETTKSPSWVAWREIEVFASEA